MTRNLQCVNILIINLSNIRKIEFNDIIPLLLPLLYQTVNILLITTAKPERITHSLRKFTMFETTHKL